jgi:hypothetical protein
MKSGLDAMPLFLLDDLLMCCFKTHYPKNKTFEECLTKLCTTVQMLKWARLNMHSTLDF